MMKRANKTITLAPIRISYPEFDGIEKRIKELFKKEFYIPLLKELQVPENTLKNSLEDLGDALRSGRLTFYRGTFSGKLNATLSKELRKLGAKFDRRTGCYKIKLNDLPYELRGVIAASENMFLKKVAAIDETLSKIVPEELAEKIKVADLFDRTIYKTETEFEKSVKNITIQPKLSPQVREKIASDYAENLKLYITDWTKKNILDLRQKVWKSVQKGNRYEALIDTIQQNYNVSCVKKAKFLARQETMLAISSLKEARYQEAGLDLYKWQCVTGTALHPVRPGHRMLNDRSQKGEVFRFSNPPQDSAPGEKVTHNNPMKNYGCRCIARIVIALGPKDFITTKN